MPQNTLRPWASIELDILLAPDKILNAFRFAENRGRNNSAALPYRLIPPFWKNSVAYLTKRAGPLRGHPPPF